MMMTWMPEPLSSSRSVSDRPSSGVFGGDIGAAKGGGDEAEDGGAVDDAAGTLAAHDRDHAPGKLVPAEEVALELGAEIGGGEVLERPRLRIAAIVEERVEPAAGPRQHLIERRGKRRLVVIVGDEGVQPLGREAGPVRFLADAGEDLPAALLQPNERRNGRCRRSSR